MAEPRVLPRKNLHPCRYCAGEIRLTQYSWRAPAYWVQCYGNGCDNTVTATTSSQAVRVWNRENPAWKPGKTLETRVRDDDEFQALLESLAGLVQKASNDRTIAWLLQAIYNDIHLLTSCGDDVAATLGRALAKNVQRFFCALEPQSRNGILEHAGINFNGAHHQTNTVAIDNDNPFFDDARPWKMQTGTLRSTLS